MNLKKSQTKTFIPEPDFTQLRKVLFGKKPERIPIIDLYHDIEIKCMFLGRELFDIEDDIEFFLKAGYDYYGFLVEYDFYGEKWPGKLDKFDIKKSKKIDHTIKTQSRTYQGILNNLEEAQNLDWPTLQDIDFSKAEGASKKIPSGMMLIPWTRGIYETVSEMLGYGNFCSMLYDNPELLEFLFNKIGKLKVQLMKRLADIKNVGALWMGDDLAFTESLLFPPKFMRQYLFPWYKKIGDICKEKNIPLIFHSDGRLYEILDELIECGINAIHPLEPKAMDPIKLQEMYLGRLGLLGNIDLDIMARGTPGEIQKLVKNNIELLGSKGGYAVGASNTVPYYIKVENFIAMLEEVKRSW